MSQFIEYKQDCVAIVGGAGNQGGQDEDNGGLATQEWWDAQSSPAAAFAKLQATDGGYLIEELGVEVQSGGLLESEGAFVGAEVGMAAHLWESTGTGFAPGWYEITATDGDSRITCVGIEEDGEGEFVDIRIGGAFANVADILQIVFVDLTARMRVFVNKDHSTTTLLTCGGSTSNNTQLIIEAFNTIPGDCNEGGEYYASPFTALLNGGPVAGSYRKFTSEFTTNNYAVRVEGADNVVFRNFVFDDTGTFRGVWSSNSAGTIFDNCGFTSTNGAYKDDVAVPSDGVLFYNCYFAIGGVWNISAYGIIYILGCVGIGTGVSLSAFLVHRQACTMLGCLLVGFYQLSRSLNASLFAYGNICYNFKNRGIMSSGSIAILAFSNIIMPTDDAVPVFQTLTDGGGTIGYDRGNVFINVDGTPPLFHQTLFTPNGRLSIMSILSREIDPKFINAVNNDFRLLRESPCLSKGFGGFPDNYYSTGIWGFLAKHR